MNVKSCFSSWLRYLPLPHYQWDLKAVDSVFRYTNGYDSISVLIYEGIIDVFIISTFDDLLGLKHLLGDGSNYGEHFKDAEHPSLDDLELVFIIFEKFIGKTLLAWFLVIISISAMASPNYYKPL